MLSAHGGHVDCLRLLLEAGADANAEQDVCFLHDALTHASVSIPIRPCLYVPRLHVGFV